MIFGTRLLAMALTSLAPALMMPACSAVAADHEAVDVLQEQTIGSQSWLQSMMNRAALSALST